MQVATKFEAPPVSRWLTEDSMKQKSLRNAISQRMEEIVIVSGTALAEWLAVAVIFFATPHLSDNLDLRFGKKGGEE